MQQPRGPDHAQVQVAGDHARGGAAGPVIGDVHRPSRHAVASEQAGPYRPTLHNWGPIVVPESRYFALGDNREQSLDSRFWGFVPEDHIVGKAFFIWLSIDRNASFVNKIRWSRFFKLIK